MPNPLFGLLGGNAAPQMPGNIANMVQQFQRFRSMFSGDPRQQVQQLLNSGQMTQEQYNQLSSMASQIMPLLRG